MQDSSREMVCPVELAGSLDNRIRKFFHNPEKILRPHIQEGMSALDLGCGPGFFTLAMSRLVGDSGSVCAADLQQGMLEIVQRKVRGTELEPRISLHLCGENSIGLKPNSFDRILMFWMLHEVPQKLNFLSEIKSFLRPNGYVFLVEPFGHVSSKTFLQEMNLAREAGFQVQPCHAPFFSRAALLGV